MARPIGPDAIYALAHVSDPCMTPDGQRVGFVLSRIDREAMEGVSQIVPRALSNSREDVFTQGTNDAYPRFPPDGRQPATLEKFTFQRQGMDIECRLWLPPMFDPDQRYSLVLDIHGALTPPSMMPLTSPSRCWLRRGYLVLTVNPRGSATYGNAYTMAVLGDWGGEGYHDLMAAVDVVVSRPYVDAARLGVHG